MGRRKGITDVDDCLAKDLLTEVETYLLREQELMVVREKVSVDGYDKRNGLHKGPN